MALTGKISFFGDTNNFHDPGNRGLHNTATGISTLVPGIAVYNQHTLGGYWRVTAPNGQTRVVRQIDIGPHPDTGRKIDFTTSSLALFGYSPNNFPTDGVAHAVYLGKHAPTGAQAAPTATRAPQAAGTPARTVQSTAFDQAGFQDQQRQAALAGLLKSKSPFELGAGASKSPLLGLLNPNAPSRADFTSTTTRTIPGTPATSASPGSPRTAHQAYSGYVNPVPQGLSFAPGRPDMGKDFNVNQGAGHTLVAIGKAKILGWKDGGAFGPNWLFYRLLDGPYKGRLVFQGHSGRVLVKPGQVVQAGQPVQLSLGNEGGAGHVEIGWASGSGLGDAQALAAPHYHEGDRTAEGLAFERLFNKLPQRRIVHG